MASLLPGLANQFGSPGRTDPELRQFHPTSALWAGCFLTRKQVIVARNLVRGEILATPLTLEGENKNEIWARRMEKAKYRGANSWRVQRLWRRR